MIQNQPSGWTICALLMAVNACALLQLSNKNLFGNERVEHSCEQNLEISRTLLLRLPSEASRYASDAQVDARQLSPSHKTLAFKDSALAALRCNRPADAKRDAEMAIQKCQQWQQNCPGDERELVTLQLMECERVESVACWQLGQKQAAVDLLDRAIDRGLSLLCSANRDSFRVKLAELAKTKAKMLRKMQSAEADRQDAIAAMLTNAPATASVGALKSAISAPPPAELWTALRSGSSIDALVKQGRLSLVEQYLQLLQKFADDGGRCINYDIATASAIGACSSLKMYSDAGRLSAALADRFMQIESSPMDSAGCRYKAVWYFLDARDFSKAHVHFAKLLGCLAQVPNSGSRWTDMCDKSLSLAFEMVAREKLSGPGLIDLMAPLQRVLSKSSAFDRNKRAACESFLQSGVFTAIMEQRFNSASVKDALSDNALADTYGAAAIANMEAKRLAPALDNLKQCSAILEHADFALNPALVDRLDRFAVDLMAASEYAEADAVLATLDSCAKDADLYRAVWRSVCLSVFKGPRAGEAACVQSISRAGSERERSLARQVFLDLLQDYYTREKPRELEHLCVPCNDNLESIRASWGVSSAEYASALLHCSSLYAKLNNFKKVQSYLNRCEEALKAVDNEALKADLAAQRANCAWHLKHDR